MRRKILVLVGTALMVLGSARPALAHPADPSCDWDWDRYLWKQYEYELWYYGCDFGDDGGWDIYAFWTPNDGYWYP